MRYILCFLLPDELSGEINLIREHFEKGVNQRIPPHISLTYPFWYANPAEEITEKIQNAVLSLNSFKASISEAGTFSKEDGKKVIYISVNPEERFGDLHEKLNSILGAVTFDTRFFPGQNLPEKYKPHITVAINGESADVNWVQNELEKIKGKEFLVDKISLLSNKMPKEIWKTERVFNLA